MVLRPDFPGEKQMNTRPIVGQSQLVKMMDSIIASGRVAHAYLFTGPFGAGKKTLSLLFAQALLCEGEGEKPCYSCRSCKQIDSNNHPDIYHLVKEEDKTRIIVDQIRDLRERIRVKPYQSELRIVFIHRAQEMTVQAQNALLKTLEEPPSHTKFFLLADIANELLPTIISRCQIFKVNSLSTPDTAKILMDRLDILKEEASFYATIACGIPGKALMLASNEDFKQKRDRLIEKLGSKRPNDLLDLVPLFTEDRDLAFDLFDVLVFWFRDLLVAKETGRTDKIINMDKLSYLGRQTKAFTSRALQDNIELVEKSRRAIEGYSNFQLTIENMLLAFTGGAN